MSVLSDKLQDVFMNIHNKFVDVNSRTDELFDAKADRSELPTKVSQLENDKNYVSNTDYATADVGGVVKVGQYQKGLYIIPDTKQLSIYGAEKNDVETKTTSPRPILPYRVDYAVSKSTHQTMNDEYDTTTMYVNDASMVGAQGQLPASYNAVKAYVDDMLSTKADKSDLDWKLIGETETTEEYVESVILDFGEPIEKWYRETRIDIFIPKTWDSQNQIGLNSKNGAMNITFSQTESGTGDVGDGAVNSGITLPLVASQSNAYAPLLNSCNHYGTVITEWDKNGKPIYSHILILGFGARSYPYTAYGISRYQDNFNIKKKQFLALQNQPKTSYAFKFPAGTKISLYGRL